MVSREAAGLVADVVSRALLVGDADPYLPGDVPLHLLLLSQGLLPRLLGRPAGLRRGRAAQELLGGKSLASPHPELAPLLDVRRRPLPADAWLGRAAFILVAGSR